MRNTKGQFVYRNGNGRYKVRQKNNKRQQVGRIVWEEKFGPIPHGLVIHHIDEDKTNNSIDNLAIMTSAGHCRHHSFGRSPWNKGIKYGETDAFKKAIRVRRSNQDDKCIITWILYAMGVKQGEIAEGFKISRRQISDRVKRAREVIGMGNRWKRQ